MRGTIYGKGLPRATQVKTCWESPKTNVSLQLVVEEQLRPVALLHRGPTGLMAHNMLPFKYGFRMFFMLVVILDLIHWFT